MGTPTPEEIVIIYTSALDSVSAINTILGKISKTTEDIDRLTANSDHLSGLLAQQYWTNEDLTPLRSAVSSATAWLALGMTGVVATTPPVATVLQVVKEISPVFDPVKKTWQQAWSVVPKYSTQAEIDAAWVEYCNSCCTDCCKQVDVLLEVKMYTDVGAVFPTGTKTIQFRNNADRDNLRDVCAGATVLIALGQGSTAMVYRTLDNVNQTITASEMLAIGLGVLNAKQALVSKAWEHKDALMTICNNTAITEAERITAMIAYDITAGW